MNVSDVSIVLFDKFDLSESDWIWSDFTNKHVDMKKYLFLYS